MELHYIIQIAVNIYENTGHVPTANMLRIAGVSKFSIEKYTMARILENAGISKVGKLDKENSVNNIFNKDINQHLKEYVPRKFESPKIKSKILVVGDLHFPFVFEDGLEKLYKFNRETMPNYIIQVGDFTDMYSFSKFPRSHNVYTPKEEERLALEMGQNFWDKMTKDNPNAKKIMLVGNHDIRPIKRTLESLPTLEHVVEKHFREIMTFNGVETIYDSREEYEIEGILFHHGFMSQLGQHRDASLCNFVAGHSHRGGVSYRRIRGETLWELNAGFLGDPESKAMSYSASKKTSNYTLGWGYIDCWGPRFIHL